MPIFEAIAPILSPVDIFSSSMTSAALGRVSMSKSLGSSLIVFTPTVFATALSAGMTACFSVSPYIAFAASLAV